MRNRREIIRVADAEAMAHAAAQQLLACMATSRQVIAVCLTGGSSPQRLYQLLAANAYRSRTAGSGPRMQGYLVNDLCEPITAEKKQSDFALAA